MKHTPGPWEIDYDSRPASVCTIYGTPPQGEENQQFCYIRGPIGYWDADEQENMANAMLIAAAPDLLEAMKSICNAADNIGGEHVTGLNYLLDAVKSGYAAIDKATGE